MSATKKNDDGVDVLMIRLFMIATAWNRYLYRAHETRKLKSHSAERCLFDFGYRCRSRRDGLNESPKIVIN